MKKFILILFVTLTIVLFAACDSQEWWSGHNTGEPESYYEYGFTERCMNGDKYIEITSFGISESYQSENSLLTDGCYVVLSIETNLSHEEFESQDNFLELRLSSNEVYKLTFALWNQSKGELVFKIQSGDNTDYSRFADLTVSDSNDGAFIYILLDVFDTYCTVDDVQYCGKAIVIGLCS